MKLFYFGTSLQEAGHYFWTLDGDSMIGGNLYFPSEPPIGVNKHREWAFNPEELLKHTSAYSKGVVQYFRKGGYAICAIEGSCRDKRWGTCSVFFVKDEGIKFAELVLRILQNPMGKKIIGAMPFKVEWGLSQEYTEKLNKLQAV